MSSRRSIEVEQFSHLTAIPVASMIGPLLVSSVIPAYNPGTREIPDTVEAQIANLFSHAGAILAAAGATWDDVAKMSFWLAEPRHRDALEAPWVERFPDAGARPARHTHIAPGAPMASCDLLAYRSTHELG